MHDSREVLYGFLCAMSLLTLFTLVVTFACSETNGNHTVVGRPQKSFFNDFTEFTLQIVSIYGKHFALQHDG
jgi:hypothetical protein